MPLIRLARDKRGLDTLYLLHQRRDGRGEPRLRVIYFCAMPQGTQFGRAPLDPATQRLLERRYPDVDFDWAALMREIEQRRLPPPLLDVQARRARPAKTDRRPHASDVPVEKPTETSKDASNERQPAAKRRRRRGTRVTMGESPGTSAAAPEGAPTVAPPAAEPAAAPIIEP